MSVVDVRSLARVFVLLMQADQPNQQQPLMEFDCVTERVSTAHLIDKLKQYFPRVCCSVYERNFISSSFFL